MTKKNRRNKGAGGQQKHVPYDNIVRENPVFLEYYKKQKICPDNEWDVFVDSLRADLPTTFRITAAKTETKHLRDLIRTDICTDAGNDLKPIVWYPEELAWQIELTRKEIRREPKFARLHQFLITETENGTISRQEAVSMVPPLLLDVQPHHKVLDMCASPGSKTAQIIEHLHNFDSETGSAKPSGYVLANDIDNKRCYMLVHQAKRLNSPSVLVTNHDAAQFPDLILPGDGNEPQQTLRFDRILCDVPCSGDGTIRKNPDIWLKWNQANAINHHNIQTRILRRAIDLLAVGGRLVYSTCSLNPLENEAVIGRVVDELEGAVRVVNVSGQLVGLKSYCGLSSWLVTDKQATCFYETYDQVPEATKALLRPQMFPSTQKTICDQLKNCLRILPHRHNSGAFFVAVLEKTATNDQPETVPESLISNHQSHGNKRRRLQNAFKEDPFVFFDLKKTEAESRIWSEIRHFFGISDGFETANLFTRCTEGKKKNVYMCTSGVRQLIRANESRLKIINTGVRVFVRCDSRAAGTTATAQTPKCSFRLCHEGLESVRDEIGPKRFLRLNRNDMIAVLSKTDPNAVGVLIEELAVESRTIAEQMEHGSCVLEFEDDDIDSFRLQMAGWRGTNSIRAYISDINAVHYLRLLHADFSQFQQFFNKFNRPTGAADETVEPA